jgi:uncharacterized membrane protein/protein-disulfide isomerase
MSSRTRLLLIAFAVLGLGASSAATYVHYNLIRNPDYSSFCDINATVSCRAAYLSRYGSFGGVPVALAGALFFAWVLLMLWAARGRATVKETAASYIFVGSTLALAAVLYLAYASFAVLKEVCPLCVATYVAVIGLFVVSGGAVSVPLSSLPRRAGRDLGALFATPIALVVAAAFVFGGLWAAVSFPRTVERPVVVDAPPLAADQRSEFERWWDMQPKLPNFPFANDDAAVLVVEFADFQCPHCRQMYFAYKPVLEKYLSSRPKDVKFIFKPWPLSARCNASVPGVHFSATCEASAAYVMASQKGTGEQMKDWFFLHQEELSPETVRRAAADVGKIADFDAQYAKTIETIKADAAIGTQLGVNSTPSFFVNGKRVPEGGVPPQYFDALIDLELKRATK